MILFIDVCVFFRDTLANAIKLCYKLTNGNP